MSGKVEHSNLDPKETFTFEISGHIVRKGVKNIRLIGYNKGKRYRSNVASNVTNE